nr:hypothetical protein [Bacillus cereus]
MSNKQIKKISLAYSPQNVNVHIQKTNQEETTVKLSGKFSKEASEKLNDITAKKDELLIELKKNSGLSVTVNNEENPLYLTISLANGMKNDLSS